MEFRARTPVRLCSLKPESKKNNKARIRQEQIRWANKVTPITKIDIAIDYVADVLEAETDILQNIPHATEARQSVAQLVKVIGYLRQQAENLRR